MSGLCGIALMLQHQWFESGGGYEQQTSHTPSSIVVTDGNPECVANQIVCWEMNKQMHGSNSSITKGDISFKRMRWSKGDPYNEISAVLGVSPAQVSTPGEGNSFDVIIGADCLFFKEFHDDLLWTIYALLGGQCNDNKDDGNSTLANNNVNNSDSSIDVLPNAECNPVLSNSLKQPCGVVYLLQPRRSGTMQLFLDKLANNLIYSTAFDVSVDEDFHTAVQSL